MTKKILFAFAILVMYLIIEDSWRYTEKMANLSHLNEWIRYGLRYTLQIGLCLVFTVLVVKSMNRSDHVLSILGLDKNILSGLTQSLIFTLPMLIGFLIIAPVNRDTTFLDILFWSFISGFSEELIFRGFLFGLLFRVLKIGFFPAIVLASVLFGLGHLYQGNDLASTAGVFGITFAGSLIFGWLYIEWDHNLWVPIGTHILMNLYWEIFDIDATNAIGGWGANLFRLLTILLVVVLTVRKTKRDGSNIKGKLFSLDYQ